MLKIHLGPQLYDSIICIFLYTCLDIHAIYNFYLFKLDLRALKNRCRILKAYTLEYATI